MVGRFFETQCSYASLVIMYVASREDGVIFDVDESSGRDDDLCDMHGRFQESESSALCPLLLSQVSSRSLRGQTA